MENIYVTKPFLPKLEKYEEYLEEIWENGILTNKGILYIEFLNKLSKKLEINTDRLNLFCNGHNALECALKSLELNEGGEIITTPYTFVSTTHAIVNCGFKPVFCDIKESDMTIDEEKIEDLITEKTVAIVPVHVYGFPCNVEKIEQIAKKYNLKVIYDAAHAFGVEKNGTSILNYGDISMVSFHATKLFHTIEGGMTVSKDIDVSKKQEIIQNFGICSYEDVSMIGGNAKMNEFSAAMGLAIIDELDKMIEKRKLIANLYEDKLKEVSGIKTYTNHNKKIKANYAYFPIRVDADNYGVDRNQLKEILEEYGIYTRKYFYPLTCDMTCYKEKYPEYQQSDLKNARSISDEILTLPMYYDLKEEQVDKICKVLKKKK